MRVCIAYDTKRSNGATEHAVKWMLEVLRSMGVEAVAFKVGGPFDLDCDLLIAGSPVYYERPMRSVVEFLKENKRRLSSKKVAVFVVCLAIALEKLRWYVKRKYLRPLEEAAGKSLIGSTAFRGWLRRPNYAERERVAEWIRELVSSFLGGADGAG